MTNEELRAELTAKIAKFLEEERENIKNGDVARRTVEDSVGQQAMGNVDQVHPDLWVDNEDWFSAEVTRQVKAAFKNWS